MQNTIIKYELSLLVKDFIKNFTTVHDDIWYSLTLLSKKLT